MVLEMVAEEGGGSGVSASALARRQLLELRERNRGQTRLLLATKRRLKTQTELASQMYEERDLNLRSINSQLLLLEANLRRRQQELATILRQKEDTIRDQQRLILALASTLSRVTGDKKILQVLANASKENPSVDLIKILKDILALTPRIEDRNGITKNLGNTNKNNETNSSKSNIEEDQFKPIGVNENSNNVENQMPRQTEDSAHIMKEEIQTSTSPTPDIKRDTDSVTDADSAIMLEDTCSDSLVILPCMRDGVKVIRSVSDALECAARPLQLPPTNLLDSASTTPVNSCPPSPNITAKLSRSYSNSAGGSSSTTPSCSSCEDSDTSPSSTLSKARSSSILTLQDTDGVLEDDGETYEKQRLNRSVSDGPNASNRKDIDQQIQNIPQGVLESNCVEDCESTFSSIEDASNSVTCDSDSTLSDGATSDMEDHADSPAQKGENESSWLGIESAPERRLLIGAFDKSYEGNLSRSYTSRKKPDEFFQVTYNRVMGSNHRSVTKVKDVKYKRINKAKSRSLEELRGKLKIREGKPSISMSIGHSYA